MIAVPYGYAQVSEADRDDRNLETQLHELAQYGICRDLIFVDDETGTTLKRQGWGAPLGVLQAQRHHRRRMTGPVQPELRRRGPIQADLTQREIWIVAIKENIDTRDGSADAKFFRRMMLA